MPQMSPLSWLTLFIYFLMIFFIFNIMNYYIFNYNIKIKQKTKKLISFNWKW